jgi:chemotaxis protein methyltransferase CheR
VESTLKDEEIEVLRQDFMDIYGYDFSGYSHASFKRRLQRIYNLDRYTSFNEFRYRLQHDPAFFHYSLNEITVNVTEMFRDPSFYKVIKEKVIPVLATYPLIRVWHAGCSTGEEVYSLAILLDEANLLHKSLLYATDINTAALEKARKGIFPDTYMQQYSRNYHSAGGSREFSSYYTANYNFVKFDERLSRRMIFSTHNLVSDFSFNAFQLILCRNVLIYFERELQQKVLNLFDKSLEPLGYLALGSKESLRFSSIYPHYKQLESREKIWRKMR